MADLTLGKLQAALASATNEVTVAAANINFDFALVKLEAPPEYQPLGGILSSVRKKNAETGPVHVTARRLGALFDGICPQAPNLLRAYGHRVSEISAQATKTSGKHTSWIFPEHTGIDGTSIWAAATSSNASVHAHLLACMLARFWNEAEAISVWVEIIEERRREIAAQFEQGRAVPFASTAAATQQEISREQIANWDASARAWLRTADVVKDKQQKQLLLIIRNLSLPVNDEANPYQSVKKAWINAIETMEKIVVGGSFDVRDGAILVALSAWHLYPKMIVYGGPNSIQDVDMGDDLIHTGGVLNLGLSGGSKRLDGGVHWSLPLRHFKYYGSAVKRTRQLELDGARLSFSDLLMANLGALLESWGVPQSDTITTLRMLLTLMSSLPIPDNSNACDEQFVLRHCIVNPINTYFENDGHGNLLLSLGRRRHQKFGLYDSLPYFGLLDLNTLLKVLKGPDERIELLRRITKRYDPPPLEVLIVYAENRESSESLPNIASAMHSKLGDEERAWKKVASQCRWVRDSTKYRRLPNESIYSLSSRFATAEIVGSTISIPQEGKIFDLVCGESGLAEIYVQRVGLARIATTSLPLLPTDLAWCIQSHPLDSEALTRHWSDMHKPGMDGALNRLATLSAAAYVYEADGMQGATINPRLLEGKLEPNWMDKHRYVHRPDTVANEEAFNIVAHFELGYEVYVPGTDDGQEEMLGLSAGDSLYIKQQLTEDPSKNVDAFKLVRLLGNIGKPGVIFLRAPLDPIVRELDAGAWKVVQFDPFDGRPEDCFQGTTLHLSLTDWSLPITSVASYGQRDVDALICEATISVRDSGVWVADVSASLAETANIDIARGRLPPCRHPRVIKPPQHMTSLKSWDEILEGHGGFTVVRSYNNWLARRAITFVLLEHCPNTKIIVCPEDMCWGCVPPDQLKDNHVWIY